MRERLMYAFGTVGSVLLIYNLYIILLGLPDEADQGAIYRIMFYHIPAFFTAGLCYIVALVGSSMYLIKKDGFWDALAVSATEVGLVFAAVNLITGMFWGRIIWGIWWAWDPRLTWALICWLVYFGYMMLRRAIDDPTERAKIAGVLSIFAFVSVSITWKAIEWWRTQHPGPVLSFRTAHRAHDLPELVGAAADRDCVSNDPHASGAIAARDRCHAPAGARTVKGDPHGRT